MQKRFIVAILLIIAPFMLLYFLSNKDISQGQRVVNAFYNSKANILTSVVRYKGELYDNNKDDEGLKRVVEKISTLFKIDPCSMERYQNSSDTYREHGISGLTPGNNYIRARAWAEYDQRSEKETGYVEIEQFCDGLWNNVDEVKRKVEESLGNCIKKSQTTYYITGVYEGKLDDKQLEEIRDRILNYSRENEINVFAYSPLYNGYTIPDSRKANLKLSIRYSPYENKTFISISSPIEIK
ncbi:MAG: hypothetical protein GX066_02585 [Clostridiaceae bacterium]|nr:hypothetical protein [Clostridiaceae bacterium]